MPGAKPTALKMLNGRKPGHDTAGRPIPAEAFKSTGLPMPMPDWLHPEAVDLWEKTAPTLETLNLSKPEDHATFAAYCQAWSTFVRASKRLNKEGLTIMTTVGLPDGGTQDKPMVNPIYRTVKESGEQLRKFAKEFGLTPVASATLSRARAEVTGAAADASNPFAGPAEAKTG